MDQRKAFTEPCMHFARGLCAKGDDCTYLHDKRTIQKKVPVERLLRDYVQRQGGEISGSSGLAAFYQEYPDAKAAIGGKVRKFCEQHSELLHFQVNSGAGMILSTVLKGRKNERVDTVAGPTCSDSVPPALKEVETATLLRDFVDERGGEINPGGSLAEFYRAHPEAQRVIGGKVREFCEQHLRFLRFKRDSGAGTIFSVRKKAASSTESSMARAGRPSGSQLLNASSSVGAPVARADMSAGSADAPPGMGASACIGSLAARVDRPPCGPDEPDPREATKSTPSLLVTVEDEKETHVEATPPPSEGTSGDAQRLQSPPPGLSSTLACGSGQGTQEKPDPWMNSNDPWSASRTGGEPASMAPAQTWQPARRSADADGLSERAQSSHVPACETAVRTPCPPQSYRKVDGCSIGSTVCGNCDDVIDAATAKLDHLIKAHQQAVNELVIMKADLNLAKAKLATRQASLEAKLAVASAREEELAAREARMELRERAYAENVAAAASSQNLNNRGAPETVPLDP